MIKIQLEGGITEPDSDRNELGEIICARDKKCVGYIGKISEVKK